MTSRRLLAAAILLAAGVHAARGESRPEDAVTPLGLLGRAGVVAVVRAAPGAGGTAEDSPGTLLVEEMIRGTAAKAGDTLVVAARRDSSDVRIPADLRAVAFLDPLRDGRWEVLAGAHGILALDATPAGGGGATLSLVRALAADLDAEGRLRSPWAARAALVAAVAEGPPGLRSGAALDLLSDPEMLGGATEAERSALLAAFRREENRSRARAHLARILGVLRLVEAGPHLVDALLAKDGFALRPAVGEALGALGDAGNLRALAERTAEAAAETRALIAGTLGLTGMAAARGPLEAMAGAAEAEVRWEVAVGLGRLRTAEATPALLARLEAERDPGARRAVAWALAQCDHPDAWEALRAEATRTDGDAAFREFVRSVLRNPRRSFVR